MPKIIGVDFSGAGSDDAVGNTWVTEGRSGGGVLTIHCCRPISRNGLEGLLRELPDDAVAAMDFPFSVPAGFARFWQDSAGEMPGLWRAAADIDLQEFKNIRGRYVGKDRSREHLRVGDLHHRGAFSCLHDTNPNMVPMTFHGMAMLHRLMSRRSFRVPPLDDAGRSGPVLLEVMPGAALRAFKLPRTGYKNAAGVEKQRMRREKRQEILEGLPGASAGSGVGLSIPGNLGDTCLSHHDGLDSLVAAVVAAVWVDDKKRFRHPDDAPPDPELFEGTRRCISPEAGGMTELKAARLEGWIYAPKPNV